MGGDDPAQARTVFVHLEDLLVSASCLAPAVRDAAEAQGGSDIHVMASENGRELDVAFVLEGLDEDEANRRGHAVLDAVDRDAFVWQISVLQPFGG